MTSHECPVCLEVLGSKCHPETPLCRAAPAMLAAFKDYLEAEDIYNKAVTPQATAKAGYVLREKREVAQAAITKAKGETQ